MFAYANTLTFSGINTIEVNMQIHLANGLPAFNIVGLPDKTIGEAKERVRSALSSMGLSLPSKRITINLTPADILKEGSHFDLPIAVGLLIAMDILPAEELDHYILLGELGLDGKIISVNGILPAAIDAVARNKGLICPKANGKEAAWSGNETILAAGNLLELINHFKGTEIILPPAKEAFSYEQNSLDLADVKGQEIAKRCIEIAAAGNHNILMIGAPGSGKSMIASRLPSILPLMDAKEILETSMINSIAGNIIEGNITNIRPFRSPHHSCSMAAMVGGGTYRKIFPGEISLAHNGVLFLDELPEFPRIVLESLRQPLESKKIFVARAHHHVSYPAYFLLVAAMNPCKCGYLYSDRICSKAPKCGSEYQEKISGPFFDRIDICLEVETPKFGDIFAKDVSEKSSIIRERVIIAREIQLKRYNGFGIKTNSELDGNLLYELVMADSESFELLNKFAEKFKISMRSYNKILKVARTIADLDHSYVTKKRHLAEVLNYRQVHMNRNYNIKRTA